MKTHPSYQLARVTAPELHHGLQHKLPGYPELLRAPEKTPNLLGPAGVRPNPGWQCPFWRSAPFGATFSLAPFRVSPVLLQVSALQHVKTSRCKHGAGRSPRARLQSRGRSSLFFCLVGCFQLKHPQGSRTSSSTWKGKSFPGRKRASSPTPTPTWQCHLHKGTVRAKQTSKVCTLKAAEQYLAGPLGKEGKEQKPQPDFSTARPFS